MNANENTVPKTEKKESANSSKTLAFLVLRLWIGFSALASGLAKFVRTEKVFEENPDTGEMTARVLRSYSFDAYNGIPAREFERFLGDPLFPECVLQAFYYAIGPVLILSGASLIIGFATRISLVLLGLIFVALSFGLSLIDPSGSAGILGIYILAIACALLFADANRFCISRKF